MLQMEIQFYIPLCNCEGCFRDSTQSFLMETETFDVCDYHYKELMVVNDSNIEEVNRQVTMTPLAKALEYREEMFQYNSKQ